MKVSEIFFEMHGEKFVILQDQRRIDYVIYQVSNGGKPLAWGSADEDLIKTLVEIKEHYNTGEK